jgi:hypothetical protein
MLRKIVLNFAVAFLTLPSLVYGQPGPTPEPTIDPDSGSILSNAPANPASNINCWISRSSDRAVAVFVYGEPAQLRANIRQYLYNGESYSSTTTKIMNGTTQLTDQAVISVKLVTVASTKYPLLYKMVFTSNIGGTPADYDIGYLNFVRGNKQRPSSKVSISFASSKDPATGIKVTPSAGNPCDEPIIDDIGEEEEIAKSPTIANAPTNFILPITLSTGGGASPE